MRILVYCRRCGGTGQVELEEHDTGTLSLLRRKGREAHGAELARDAGIQATAMNNRLARLEKLGLLSSRVEGRKRLYALTPETRRP